MLRLSRLFPAIFALALLSLLLPGLITAQGGPPADGWQAPPVGGPDFVPGEFLVVLNGGAGAADAVAQAVGAESIGTTSFPGGYNIHRLRAVGGDDEQTLQNLRRNPLVKMAFRNAMMHAFEGHTSSDNPALGDQAPPSPGESQGPHTLGMGKVYYTDSNNFGPNAPFHEYDVATDTWTTKASLPAASTTQLASDELGVVYSLPEDGNVYRYDPGTNSWVFVIAGSPAAVWRSPIRMFEAHAGEFYWGKDGTTTLDYTSGGVWNSITTPRTISSGAAVDRSTGYIYIRTYSELGFFAFNPATLTFPQICDFGSGVLENSRVGAFHNGNFYSRDASGTYQATDVATCGVVDTLVAPTSSHSSSGEDDVGNIYSNGYNDDIVFEVYNAPTNTLTLLAPAPDIPATPLHTGVDWSGWGATAGASLPQ